MHCMGHWYAIRGVKACSSFRWIKQFTHLSVAKLLIESKNRGRVIPVLSTYAGVTARSREMVRAQSYGLGGAAALDEPNVAPPCPDSDAA